MFETAHNPGSDAWYDALEAWLVSQGIKPTGESIAIARERIMMHTGNFIPDDFRFLTRRGEMTSSHLVNSFLSSK